MPSAGFEPVISASEKLQTHALDRAATGISYIKYALSNTTMSKYNPNIVHSMNDKLELNNSI